jgi:dedicator of cytokinesis protein 1
LNDDFHFTQPVLDVYIKDNFSATLAYKKLLVVLNDCVQSTVMTKLQGDDLLRVMKALQYLFKFVVRSRQLFVNLYGDVEEGADSDFESLLLNLFASMSDFMRRSDGLVLLAQGACLKYIPCAIPDLLLVIDDQQLRFVNDLTQFYFYGFPSMLEIFGLFLILVRHWLILLRAFQPAGSTIRR